MTSQGIGEQNRDKSASSASNILIEKRHGVTVHSAARRDYEVILPF